MLNKAVVLYISSFYCVWNFSKDFFFKMPFNITQKWDDIYLNFISFTEKNIQTGIHINPKWKGNNKYL